MSFRSVTAGFFEWVERTPEAPVVFEGDRVAFTYGALANRVLCIAAHLNSQNLGADDLVGIHLPRSPEYIASIMGVWAAGAAWVYLDPSWPQARRDQVCKEGQVRLVLQEKLPLAEIGQLAEISSHDLAYAVWTSGSTGRAKGVLIEHCGLMGMLEQQVRAFELGPDKRVLLTLKPSFDASVSDVASALISGAALVIDRALDAAPLTPTNLLRAINEGRVTHADIPPALLPHINSKALPSCLQTLVIGGEVPDSEAVRAHAAKVRVVSVYGPTEATVCTSMVQCTTQWMGANIGSPMSGVTYMVCDEEGRALAAGVPGELWIGGSQVARGYVQRPELTQERFVLQGDTRWFRTRDQVSALPDGTYQFEGRLDRQFKLHGQLVAPEEVEAALVSHPGVGRAQVTKVHERLAALIQPLDADVDTQDVLRWVRLRLPAYLVPSGLSSIRHWPLTDSGKVDAPRLWAHVPVLPPSQGTQIQDLASMVLGQSVDAQQSFVSQGADSMAVLRLAAACEAQGLNIAACELGSDRPLAALSGGSDADAQSAAALEARVDWSPPSPGVCRERPVRTWLLTGATGFLGTKILLSHAAQDPDSKWILLVRGTDAAEARARLKQSCEITAPGVFDGVSSRFEVLSGDISMPNLGLAPPTYQRLLQVVEGVHHVAAEVHTFASASALWASNVQGTQNVLDFVLRGHSQVLVYASTLSVFVHTDQNEGLASEGDGLDATQWVYGGYAQTKWVAERLVARTKKPGLRKVCLRYGLITADAQTGLQPQGDLFVNLVRGLAHGGLLPQTSRDPWMDVTPVDWAARVAGALAADSRSDGRYHITAGRIRWSMLKTAMARAGVQLREVTAQVFSAAVAQATPEFASALLSLGTLVGAGHQHRGLQLFQDTSMQFDDRRRQDALSMPIMAPPSVDGDLLERYVRQILARSL